MKRTFAFAAILAGLCLAQAQAQSVTFDFDSAPVHSTFPIFLTAGGITAHFSANPAYYNYSIQAANVLGFTPPGFAGNCIYPNTVYLCDLLISFDQPLSDIAILYSPEEYGTDSSCTMRVTAYYGTQLVGTNTYRIPDSQAGTWPSGVLSLTATQPFNNVVIHYDQPPPTGGDYGPIFMADNLVVTPWAAPYALQIDSRKLHAGVPFDIPLPVTGTAGVECRSGGATNDYEVVFTFPGAVTFTNAAVTAGAGSVSNSSGSGTNTVTVDLTGITNAQRITVTLSSVNNGISTADVSVSMGVLVGDTNGDGTVNSADIGQAKSQSGNAVTGTNFREDVNLDGNINASDIGLVKSKSGTALP